MTRTWFYSRLLSTGGPVANATVQIFDVGTANLSSIFSDNGITPKANPFTTDADGYGFYYAAGGSYDIRISGGTPAIPTPYTWGDVRTAGGIVSLNALTGDVQTFATDDSGTDFSIVSTGTVHTFKLPSASVGKRGLVTTGTQSFAGQKGFDTGISLPALSANCVLLTTTAGLVTATAALTNGQVVIGTTGGLPAAATLTAGTGITITNAAGSITIGLNSAASPTFTNLTLLIVPPVLTTANIVGRTVGGTLERVTPTLNGQLLIGDAPGSIWNLTTLTAGTNITITNGPGSITITGVASGITSLNALAGAAQTFAVASTGTDFTIASSGTVHTFAIPSASAANRGLVTTAAQTFAGQKTFSVTPQYNPGASSGTATASGRLTSVIVSVGNVGVGEDDLQTYSLAANTLNVNGKAVRVTGSGTFAANGNAKRVRMYWGTTIILDMGAAIAPNGGRWHFEMLVVRDAVGTQRITGTRAYQDGTGAEEFNLETANAAAENEAAAITIKCTGEATANNDVVETLLVVEVVGA